MAIVFDVPAFCEVRHVGVRHGYRSHLRATDAKRCAFSYQRRGDDEIVIGARSKSRWVGNAKYQGSTCRGFSSGFFAMSLPSCARHRGNDGDQVLIGIDVIGLILALCNLLDPFVQHRCKRLPENGDSSDRVY